MPLLTRYLIRSGLACLVLGMVAAVLASFSPTVAVIRPTWFHLVTVGWLTQLIFGLAFWMFPGLARASPTWLDDGAPVL